MSGRGYKRREERVVNRGYTESFCDITGRYLRLMSTGVPEFDALMIQLHCWMKVLTQVGLKREAVGVPEGGEMAQPIHTICRRVAEPAPMSFKINAATRVQFTGAHPHPNSRPRPSLDPKPDPNPSPRPSPSPKPSPKPEPGPTQVSASCTRTWAMPSRARAAWR